MKFRERSSWWRTQRCEGAHPAEDCGTRISGREGSLNVSPEPSWCNRGTVWEVSVAGPLGGWESADHEAGDMTDRWGARVWKVPKIIVKTLACAWNAMGSHWGVLSRTVTLSQRIYFKRISYYWEYMEGREKNEIDQKEDYCDHLGKQWQWQ